MKYRFPQVLIDFFKSEALKNPKTESHAFAVGKRLDDTILVQELIFPNQEGENLKHFISAWLEN